MEFLASFLPIVIYILLIVLIIIGIIIGIKIISTIDKATKIVDNIDKGIVKRIEKHGKNEILVVKNDDKNYLIPYNF